MQNRQLICVQDELVYPNEDDTALVMFTSGTTSSPKGVVYSHKQILGSLASSSLLSLDAFGDEDLAGTFLAYLPLAHIFEFTQGKLTQDSFFRLHILMI